MLSRYQCPAPWRRELPWKKAPEISPTTSVHLRVMIMSFLSTFRMISVRTLFKCQKGLYPLWRRPCRPAHHLPRAFSFSLGGDFSCLRLLWSCKRAAFGLLGPPNEHFSPSQNFLPAATGHTRKSQSILCVLWCSRAS